MEKENHVIQLFIMISNVVLGHCIDSEVNLIELWKNFNYTYVCYPHRKQSSRE